VAYRVAPIPVTLSVFSVSHDSRNIARINDDMFTHGSESTWPVISPVLLKLKEFLRSQARKW